MPVAPRVQAQPTGHHHRQLSLVQRFFHIVNLPLLVAAAALLAYGLLVVWSATKGSTEYQFSRQLLGVAIGLVLMSLIWAVDYRKLARFTYPLLVLDVLLILMPLLPVIGVSANGARSWIKIFGQQLQPCEFAKIVTIIYMAALVARYDGKLDSGKEYLKVAALMVVPLISILLQPDLGTGMVFFVIGIVIMFTGGARRKWLLITAVVLIIAVLAVFLIDPYLDQLAGHDVFLKQYQKNRLLVFLDNNIDPTGVSYNLNQAKIAIGSGGLFGKGLGNATQSTLGFLPEAPTDFIFCVLAEQFGFAGSALLIALYTVLLIITFYIALNATDRFGTLIVMGVIGMWVFQIFENIGMDCGVMPITGIPLPFMSFGSSFMIVNFMALGLILSVWAHRDPKKV
jgi:rod shape determining protein RodA